MSKSRSVRQFHGDLKVVRDALEDVIFRVCTLVGPTYPLCSPREALEYFATLEPRERVFEEKRYDALSGVHDHLLGAVATLEETFPSISYTRSSRPKTSTGRRRAKGRADKSDRRGPGNAILLEVEAEHVLEVFTGFGRVGTSAERVAEEAVAEMREWLAADVPVGPHLADQLLLPLALFAGGTFRTLPPTRHARTNAEVIARFLPAAAPKFTEDGTAALVTVPAAARS